MTFTLMLIANVVLDVALLAGLAFALTRPANLAPHRPGVTGNAWRLRRAHRRAPRATYGEHPSGALSHALD